MVRVHFECPACSELGEGEVPLEDWLEDEVELACTRCQQELPAEAIEAFT